MTLEQDLDNARKKLRDVEAEEERLETESWMVIPVFFVSGILSVILMGATGSDAFGILFLIGFGWLAKVAFFGGEQDLENRKAGILTEINNLNGRIRRQGQRKARETKRKREQKTRDKELNLAKQLVEKGGIDNINKAIGIFQKYEK